MIFHCESVEEAKKTFPHLAGHNIVEINTLDGPLVLFAGEELTEEDIKMFEKYTRKEIIDAFEGI